MWSYWYAMTLLCLLSGLTRGTIDSSTSICAPSQASTHRLCSGSMHETEDPAYVPLSSKRQTMGSRLIEWN
ncbi:hypothetical protein DFJ58DRAFT_250588 [Suillus subalutaceus]|uniref:uncharacterized protein n=1 Tax=Suillus subalutaceus TaxID=48586 RepID=UPI001B85C14F|nr:uncharacterized protein DFJ58DRAFT_250588 [Suillus subalutaceus]KAG1861560.1 hypothetical protein DFJ58DRAFT_250588 [Suillus subalutaceus]